MNHLPLHEPASASLRQGDSPPAFDSSTTVVLICYNSTAYLEGCLGSLRTALTDATPVLIIDNASTDGSAELVRRLAPDWKLVALQQNIGHSAACNLAFQLAATTWVLLLDHDTYVPADWLAPLLAAAEHTWPDTAMVSSRAILVQQNRIHHDGGFAHFVGHMTLKHGFAPVSDHPVTAQTLWEVGAQASTSLLVHRARALACGGFDARFFIYLNDFELSLRMRLRGWRCYVAPISVVYHLQGNVETSWRGRGAYPERRAFLIYRNRWMLLLKLYSFRTLFLCAPAILLYELVLAMTALRKGWLGVYAQAFSDILRQRKAILRQRKAIQRSRAISDRELLSAHGFSFVPGLVSSAGEQRIQRLLEFIMALYWRLIAPLLGR